MAVSHLLLLLAGLTLASSAVSLSSSTFVGEWTSVSSRMNNPKCIDIPENLTLCSGMSYHRMRLPNLLDHDTMSEVFQQAGSWVPLYNLKCHPNTQLFLCSLFSPICLDRLIYPCRSLCEAVKKGCEGRMKTYGFPWPDMVRCDKFPIDNDMCIGPPSQNTSETPPCIACNQAETYENIIDNFCQADFVIKTKIRKMQHAKISCKKARILKLKDATLRKDLRRPTLKYANISECCGSLSRAGGKKGRVLIMGNKNGESLVPSFIMEWRKSPTFKSAIRTMKKLDCSDPKIISETMLADGILSSDRKRRNGGHSRRRNKRKHRKNERGGGRRPADGTTTTIAE